MLQYTDCIYNILQIAHVEFDRQAAQRQVHNVQLIPSRANSSHGMHCLPVLLLPNCHCLLPYC